MQNKVSKRHASNPCSKLFLPHPPSQITEWKTLKETISRKWPGMPQMARNAANGEFWVQPQVAEEKDCPQVGLRE
jgi:hypothetical protein